MAATCLIPILLVQRLDATRFIEVNGEYVLSMATRNMTSQTTDRKVRRQELSIAAQIALGAFLAYLIGYFFTGFFPDYLPKIGGLWSAISAVVVIQLNRKDTTTSASLRVIGSAIGAMTSAVYLSFLPFHPIGIGVAIFATGLVCTTFNIPDYMRLSAITVLVVMVTASLDPKLSPAINALLRFAESCIGSAIAFLLAALWPKHLTN